MDPPGRVQIIRAIPPGSRRLRGQRIERTYLEALRQYPEFQEMCCDRRRQPRAANMLEVAKWLARFASYSDGTTRPTRDLICKLAGVCETTWKAVRRLLEAWGFAGLVVAGTTDEFRPMGLRRKDAPNTAAVYVLCVPAPRPASSSAESRPPTASARTLVQRPARAREANPGNPDGPASGRTPHEAGAPGAPVPVARVMRTAAGKSITDGWCAWIWGPFGAAGWSARDLLWAIDHEPDGPQHRLSAAIRHPVGWLRWRLGRWLGPDGTPVASPSQQRQAYSDSRIANQAARRAEADRLEQLLEQQAGRPNPARLIRERLGWARPEEARPIVRWIQYPDDDARRGRRDGTPHSGQLWQDGPEPGTIWAVPDDWPDRLFVLVHRFESRPGANYAVDTEQGPPAENLDSRIANHEQGAKT